MSLDINILWIKCSLMFGCQAQDYFPMCLCHCKCIIHCLLILDQFTSLLLFIYSSELNLLNDLGFKFLLMMLDAKLNQLNKLATSISISLLLKDCLTESTQSHMMHHYTDGVICHYSFFSTCNASSGPCVFSIWKNVLVQII